MKKRPALLRAGTVSKTVTAVDTPTAKARGILEKSDCLRNPYSQRACQQPSTQSLKAEVLVTFLCDVARSVDVCVIERVFFGTVQSPFDAFA